MNKINFIHISDVRLGAVPDKGCPWSGSRAEDVYETFANVIEAANAKKADFLFISGNLFDHVPNRDELERVDRLFGNLKSTCVIYIPGPADCMSPDSALSGYRFKAPVYVPGGEFVSHGNAGDPVYAERMPEATMALDCISFCKLGADIYGAGCFGAKINPVELEDAAPYNHEHVNIIMACGSEERRLPVSLKALKKHGFDYTALGGTGRYETLANGTVCFPGSPEALSGSSPGRHGYICGYISKDGVFAEFTAISKREYKTISYPVGNYTKNVDVQDDILRILEHEGRQNIYTINIVRSADCEKSFDISDALGDFCILRVNGEQFVRTDYSEYRKANRNTPFGKLIDYMENSGLKQREGSRLAVDEIIEVSGLYKKNSRRLGAEAYDTAKREALGLFEARCKACENMKSMREYEQTRKQYEVSPDVLSELNSVWAEERKTELGLQTARARLAELPKQYRRKWITTGMRTAVVPLLISGIMSVLLLPPSIASGSSAAYENISYVAASIVLVTAVTLLAYFLGYRISRRLGTQRRNAADAKNLTSETADLEAEITKLDITRSALHEQRTKLQELDGQRREIREQMTQKEQKLEAVRYRVKTMRDAMDILNRF